MRTTVDLEDGLFRRAKAQAAMEGIPLKDLLERGVRLALDRTAPGKKPYRVKFPLLDKKSRKKIAIPDDIAHRMQQQDDRERYEASL
jgi:hypothetical protein